MSAPNLLGTSFGSPRCYDSFKNHLVESGFTIYPGEFDCISSKHPLVDLAAKMGSFYWAFEYKSKTDSISRGVEQIRCYSEWFDYVVLVTEKYLDHTRSELFWDLKGLGAGVWNYWPNSDKCVTQINPKLQKPYGRNRKHVSSRFRALNQSNKRRLSQLEIESGVQSRLCGYF